jgi:HSP20 family protein
MRLMSVLMDRARQTLASGRGLGPEATGHIRSMPMTLRAYLTPPIRVEEYVSDDRFVVRAELAGADPGKDLDVSVGSGRLIIQEHRDLPEGIRQYRSEFRHGTLTRTVALPREADESDVTARYGNGVLEVSVHLTEPEPAHKVEITREEGLTGGVTVRHDGG